MRGPEAGDSVYFGLGFAEDARVEEHGEVERADGGDGLKRRNVGQQRVTSRC